MRTLAILVAVLLGCTPSTAAHHTGHSFEEIVEAQRWCLLYVTQINEYKTLKICHKELVTCTDDHAFKKRGFRTRVVSECFRQDGDQNL